MKNMHFIFIAFFETFLHRKFLFFDQLYMFHGLGFDPTKSNLYGTISCKKIKSNMSIKKFKSNILIITNLKLSNYRILLYVRYFNFNNNNNNNIKFR